MIENYHKVYKQYYGPIPLDEDGRSYDIHHIDGNHANNDPTNLKAITIQEHYNIHYQQKDWNACMLIALRLIKSVDEISDLASKANMQRIKDETHHFIGKTNPVYSQLQKGTHPFANSQFATERNNKLVKNGTHNFITNNPSPYHKGRKRNSKGQYI